MGEELLYERGGWVGGGRVAASEGLAWNVGLRSHLLLPLSLSRSRLLALSLSRPFSLCLSLALSIMIRSYIMIRSFVAMIDSWLGGVPQEKKMLKGHLPRVICYQVAAYENYYQAWFGLGG
jgi:hypothetical protein